MDLRRMRTFVAMAELGTVSKAAPRLRIKSSYFAQFGRGLHYKYSHEDKISSSLW